MRRILPSHGVSIWSGHGVSVWSGDGVSICGRHGVSICGRHGVYLEWTWCLGPHGLRRYNNKISFVEEYTTEMICGGGAEHNDESGGFYFQVDNRN